MSNPYKRGGADLLDIPHDYIPVTPGASVIQDHLGKECVLLGLYVEGNGSVTVEMQNGQSRTINVGSNQYIMGRFTKVTAATATGIHALSSV